MSPHAMSDLRSRLREDVGASLVLTMVFIMGVGIVVVALLGYAQAGITSAKATQDRHLLASDASGAMDVAINALRNSTYADSAVACPANVNGVDIPGADGQLVRVLCQPKAGTGVSAGIVPITLANRPGSAVLTLGTSASEAGLAKGSNGILRIKGRVYINSNIAVGGTACPGVNCSEINVDQAPVVAKSGCTAGRVVSTVSVNCAGTGNPPEGKDPNLLTNADIPVDAATFNPGGAVIAAGYNQPPSGVAQMAHQIVPASCPAGLSVEFDPGYYDDAAALTNLSNTCSKPLHFMPGTYFFDFRNEEVGAIAAGSRPIPSGTNVWTINNANSNFYVVGGTAKDWVGGTPSNFPGSCVSPLTTTLNNEGVQFIFGGSSRIDVQAGRIELCGQYSTDRPALVVYGAKAGATTLVAPLGSLETTAISPTPATSDVPFISPGQALVRDAAPATVTISRPSTNTLVTASASLTGMDLASQIPAGSILVSAELRVTHKESTSRPQDQISVSLLPNPTRSGPPPTASTSSVPVNSAGAYTTSVVDLTTTLMKEVWRYGLADLRVDYVVSAGRSNGSNTSFVADLDAAQLWVSWKPPSLRGQTTAINGANCVGAVPPATSCPLLRTNGAQTKLYLQGTTYAPRATFNINLTNVSGQVFKSGIVARSLSVSVTPSAGFVGPVIEIPDETGSGVDLEVFLAAYVCRDSAVGCASTPPGAEWRQVGRSTLSLFSADPVPSGGGRKVTVDSWHLLE